MYILCAPRYTSARRTMGPPLNTNNMCRDAHVDGHAVCDFSTCAKQTKGVLSAKRCGTKATRLNFVKSLRNLSDGLGVKRKRDECS